MDNLSTIIIGLVWLVGSVLTLYLWACHRTIIQHIPKFQQPALKREADHYTIGTLLCLLLLFVIQLL